MPSNPPNLSDEHSFDHVIVGAGLQGGLLALALLDRRPESRIALVDQTREAGGSKTWSFHAHDLPEDVGSWIDPLIQYSWDSYEVRFPSYSRILDSAYHSLTLDHLRRVLHERFASHPKSLFLRGLRALEIEPRAVVLENGTTLRAQAVIQATGATEVAWARDSSGYQKFLGLELALEADHALERPVVMDSLVDQGEGYRFFYLLPFDRRRVLVEDTRFTDSPHLDSEAFREEVLSYAERLGLRVASVIREELGVLPMPWSGHRIEASGPPLRAGYSGGWMHPATGYSFSLAAHLAQAVAASDPEQLFEGPLRALARSYASASSYARFLNRLLFKWFEPAQRRHVFERFYRMPEPVIRRFYALRPTWGDRARVLSGRPPQGFSFRARWRAKERKPAHPPLDPQHA